MASYVPPKINTAWIGYIGLVSQADTKLLLASPTIAAGDFKVSIDGGALNNLTTLPTVTPAAGYRVKISLSAAEMNGENISVSCIDAAGAEWCSLLFNIPTSTRQIDDLATPTNITAGTITTATNVTTVNGLAANVITAASIATDAIDSDAIAASAVTEIQSGLATAAALLVVDDFLDTEIADIQSRLPAALIGGRIDANMGAISSDAIAADNAESFFDGTGYAGTGNTIPTVTTLSSGVTVTTNNDKTGYGLSSAAIQAIWDALTSALTTVGSIGKKLSDWVIGTAQTGDAYAVVNDASFGNSKLVRSTTPANTLDVSVTGEAGLDFNNIKDATAGHTLTNITVPVVTTAVNLTTNNDKTGYGLSAAAVTAIWAYVVEGTHTAVGYMRLFASALVAKLSGAATSTIVIRDIDDTKNRISVTVDADGNRSAFGTRDET